MSRLNFDPNLTFGDLKTLLHTLKQTTKLYPTMGFPSEKEIQYFVKL